MRRPVKFGGFAIALLLAVARPSLAQGPISFQYFYDDLNQLTRVVDSTGVMIQYVYDAVGNMQQILRSTVASGTLAIFNITPQQSPVGATVTIQGQGFSATASANIVTFNGVSATVISATTTTLVVQVPLSATSGPLVIKVGSSMTTYDSNFQILPIPVITSMSSKSALFNTTIPRFTVTGGNLAAATFSFSTSAITITSASTDPSGASATLSLSIGSQAGTFALVATNSFGNSTSAVTPTNRFTVVDPNSNALGANGYSAVIDAAFGVDPLDPNAVLVLPSLRETESSTFSVLNGAVTGAGIQETESVPFSILNGAVAGASVRETESLSFSVLNGAVAGASLHETESVTLSVLNGAVAGAGIRETESVNLSVLNGAVGASSLRETESMNYSVKNSATFSLATLPSPTDQPKQAPPGTETGGGSNGGPAITSFTDSDADGLPDWLELLIGTDPFNPDTDGDGLSDGDEFLQYHTNPLKPDTDGDGYSDGDEVKAGSDPLDPLSTPLFPRGAGRSSLVPSIQTPAVSSPLAYKQGDNNVKQSVKQSQNSKRQIVVRKPVPRHSSFSAGLLKWWKSPSSKF